jgi:integrase
MDTDKAMNRAFEARATVRGAGLAAILGVALTGAIAGARPSSADGPLPEDAKILALVDAQDIRALKALGPAVAPKLAQIYGSSTVDRKIQIAWDLYELGIRSSEAKQALMRDIKTPNESLRVQVQYALGRVSDDPDVVEVLLDGMRNGETYLFRDKAACALAYDQVHLKPPQKIRLFEGLIDSLEHPSAEVRGFARLALQIQTGKGFGFVPNGDPAGRAKALRLWRSWLSEYKAQY